MPRILSRTAALLGLVLAALGCAGAVEAPACPPTDATAGPADALRPVDARAPDDAGVDEDAPPAGDAAPTVPCGRGTCAAGEVCTVRERCIRGGPGLLVEPGLLAFGPRPAARPVTLPLRLTARSAPVTLHTARLAAGTGPAFTVTGLSPDETVLAPGEELVLFVTYEPPTPVPPAAAPDDTGTLLLETSAPTPAIAVPLSGRSTARPCLVPEIVIEEGLLVAPSTGLHLQGAATGSDGPRRVARWEWSVAPPDGWVGAFEPAASAAAPTLRASVVGRYQICLVTWDEADTPSCEPTCTDVDVVPDAAIYVELLWQTPGDPDESDSGANAGTDLDLHVVHPLAAPPRYFDGRYDCYSANPQPDWGAPGNAVGDNPTLREDDVDGAGPEAVRLEVPEANRSYEVAVYFGADHGWGAALATVRVFLFGERVFERRDVSLVTYDLWCVVYVDWPTGATRRCEGPDGGDAITPDVPPWGFDPGP